MIAKMGTGPEGYSQLCGYTPTLHRAVLGACSIQSPLQVSSITKLLALLRCIQAIKRLLQGTLSAFIVNLSRLFQEDFHRLFLPLLN